jgi:hypothetical protein
MCICSVERYSRISATKVPPTSNVSLRSFYQGMLSNVYIFSNLTDKKWLSVYFKFAFLLSRIGHLF